MSALDERGMLLTEQLQETAGINSRDDAYKAGYIAAVKDFLQVSTEEIKES